MTNTPTTAASAVTGPAPHRRPAGSGLALPLWIAAISLAVLAVVLIFASIQLLDALHATQASVVELQQQVGQLKAGLGGLLGG